VHILVALGGNALLKRGEALSAAAQQAPLREAAQLLAAAIQAGHHLTITHGNGPQVGLLALQSLAGPAASTLPLDVLGAESEGWIGYALELELRNALPPGTPLVTLLTQTRVDPADPAFAHPVKPIGPVYDEATAHRLAGENHWTIAPDTGFWRRVVASPMPLDIIELTPIRQLVAAGTLVICGGGGGIPVIADASGKLSGVEAVIDKDATSALLAAQLGADLFIMLTDVDGVYLDYGTPRARLLRQATPDALPAFKPGSMGPKVAAAGTFARQTGRPAAIGALKSLPGLISGTKGTRISE